MGLSDAYFLFSCSRIAELRFNPVLINGLNGVLRYGEIFLTPEVFGVSSTLPSGYTKISRWRSVVNHPKKAKGIATVLVQLVLAK